MPKFPSSTLPLYRKKPPALPENNRGKKYMFGVTRVDDKGKIALPKKCREVFNLKTGDAVLVLGDEDRGIAVIKIAEIFEG